MNECDHIVGEFNYPSYENGLIRKSYNIDKEYTYFFNFFNFCPECGEKLNES